MLTQKDIKIRTYLTDGGLMESGIKDSKHCTVSSLAIAAGIPYEEAFEIAKTAGRKANDGFYIKKLMATARKYGIRFKKLKYKSITLQKFLSLDIEGRFVVNRKGHAFSIINGQIFDTLYNAPRQILIEIYMVENHRRERMKTQYDLI
jgi:hypothetical protein